MINLFNKSIKISEEKDFLKILSQGERTEFNLVILNAEKIHKAIQNSNKRLVLLDYRLTVFKLPHNEGFNLMKVFELRLKDFKEMKMAVIVNSTIAELGEFWASICRKRGFNYEIFRDEKEAEDWLLQEN